MLEDTLEPNICQRATLVKKVNIKTKWERQYAKLVLLASIKIRTCTALSLDAKIVVPGRSVLSQRKLLAITAQEGNFELEERVPAHLLAHVQSVLLVRSNQQVEQVIVLIALVPSIRIKLARPRVKLANLVRLQLFIF
jgi:hypothetical protein